MTTVFIRKSGGNWNNNPAADPVTNIGGINISAMNGTMMFPTIQGSGDGSLLCNFGATAFHDTVPTGYTAGWPAIGGGFTTLNPSALYGSGVLSGGNLACSFNTTAGMAQAIDGYTTGKYYFEITMTGRDLFSNTFGGGVGANYASGGDFNFWFSNARFNAGSVNGGARFEGGSLGNSFAASLGALGASIASNVFTFGIGDVVDIAVFLVGPPPGVVGATIAETWFSNTAGFVDLTSVANRRKFISVTGGAQNLGVNGELPFGTSPVVFLTNTGVPSSFALNNGRGGSFQQIGGGLTHGAADPPGTSTSVTTPGAVVVGRGVLGDYLTGNLYSFNPATYLDNGTQRKWVRRWRALPQASPAADRFDYLSIVMETGVGIPPNSNPHVVLRWSDDGGKSWTNGRILSVGKSGETAFTVKANRLGSTRRFSGSDRLFELSSTDPFRVALLDADLEGS